MNPEDLKDVLTKLDDFPKPAANPLVKLLATGLANYEGEKWAKHRRIINPTFHLEKLKVLQIIIFTSFYASHATYSLLHECYDNENVHKKRRGCGFQNGVLISPIFYLLL